jgi:predicted lactoylglutathione lyase
MSSNRQLFVNLAVDDLERSAAFFTALGLSFDPRFTDETATCMVIGDGAYVMLLTKAKFADFTKKPIVDASSQTEVILAISASSREGVDELADAALASGGAEASDPLDYGFMYSRSFQDPDGHAWEVLWMDEAAAEQAQATNAAATQG